MKVYIAGKMTGIPEKNFPKFNKVAKIWRDAGFEVVNPAELENKDTTLTYEKYYQRDIEEMMKCDAIAVLDDAIDSKGAKGEIYVGFMSGKPVYDAYTFRLLKPSFDFNMSFEPVYEDKDKATVLSNVREGDVWKQAKDME